MEMSSVWSVLSLVLLVLLQIAGSDNTLEALRRAPRVRRVIGGMEVTEDGRWPWLVHVNGKVATRFIFWGRVPVGWVNLYCGGTILNSRWILTAAHCFRTSNSPRNSEVPKYWHIRAGENDNSPSFGDRVKHLLRGFRSDWRIWNVHADRIVIHPQYTERNSWKNDIALVHLRDPLPLDSNPNIGAAVLPPSDEGNWPADNETCVVKGWGCTQDGRQISETAQEAILPKMNDRQCQRLFGSVDVSTKLCAGYANRGVGICAGDSGGPLVCKRGANWFLAGIASYTAADHPENYPGVFTRVPSYLCWIKNTIHGNNRCRDI